MPHPEVVDLQNVRHFKDIITYLTSEFEINVHSFRVQYSIFIIFIKKKKVKQRKSFKFLKKLSETEKKGFFVRLIHDSFLQQLRFCRLLPKVSGEVSTEKKGGSSLIL